jgi:vacuolar-type H+-ATPase subunit H
VVEMSSFDREKQVKQLHTVRKEKTKKKVDEAIQRLITNSKVINFNSVAKEAGVTKATLYNHSDIRERIDFLRNQQEKEFVNSRIKRDENNQNAVIESLKRRIEKLEKKNKELESENRRLREKEKEKLSDYFLKIYN